MIDQASPPLDLTTVADRPGMRDRQRFIDAGERLQEAYLEWREAAGRAAFKADSMARKAGGRASREPGMTALGRALRLMQAQQDKACMAIGSAFIDLALAGTADDRELLVQAIGLDVADPGSMTRQAFRKSAEKAGLTVERARRRAGIAMVVIAGSEVQESDSAFFAEAKAIGERLGMRLVKLGAEARGAEAPMSVH